MKRSHYLFAILGGVFFALSFAPIELPGLAFIGGAILFGLLSKLKTKNAFKLGFMYGLAKYGMGVSWIYVCVATFSNAPLIIAVLVTALFIIFLACYEACMAATFAFFFQSLSPTLKMLGFALLAILFEWLRGTLFTGFPWLLLGHALINTSLSSVVPIIGSFGLGFIGFLLSAFLAYACLENKNRYFILFVLPFLLVSPLSYIQWTDSYKHPLKVTLIQGNVSQNQKWVRGHIDDIIERYFSLTNNSWRSDLIVWPETAIPMASLYIKDLLTVLDDAAKRHHSHLLIGVPFTDDGERLTNAMMMLGSERKRYEKKHLVPFGEYIPFDFLRDIMGYFNIPLGALKAGLKTQTPLLFDDITIAPFICYDIAFSHLILPYLPKSNLIVTISDDSWYGHSFAKAQHLQIARMRSLETGRYQLFSTNNGITAFIDDKGKIIKHLHEDTIDKLTGEIELRTGYTPWSHYGDIPIIMLFSLTLMALILLTTRRFSPLKSA